MPETVFTLLEGRGVIAVSGDDRVDFLQGLVSNDIAKVTPQHAVHTAFLSAQGKYLHDFFVATTGDALLLDVERARKEDLIRRLQMYVLRSKVSLEDLSADLAVAAVVGDRAAELLGLADEPGAAAPFGGGIAFMDPRLADAGARVVLPANEALATLDAAGLTPGKEAAYDRLRIALGLPDGSRDQQVDKALLLENGYMELGSIDWDKGCYMGQELTARTRYRGLVKKRLLPVDLQGPTPDPGTPILADGKEVGEIRSGESGVALALLRLDALEAGGAMTAGDAGVTPRKPAWAEF